MSDIADRVKSIIADKLVVEISEMTLNDSFVNDLGAESSDLMELRMEFEKEFEVVIPDDEAEEMQVVEDVVNYIEGY